MAFSELLPKHLATIIANPSQRPFYGAPQPDPSEILLLPAIVTVASIVLSPSSARKNAMATVSSGPKATSGYTFVFI